MNLRDRLSIFYNIWLIDHWLFFEGVFSRPQLFTCNSGPYLLAHVLADDFEGFDDDLKISCSQQTIDDQIGRQQLIEL